MRCELVRSSPGAVQWCSFSAAFVLHYKPADDSLRCSVLHIAKAGADFKVAETSGDRITQGMDFDPVLDWFLRHALNKRDELAHVLDH